MNKNESKNSVLGDYSSSLIIPLLQSWHILSAALTQSGADPAALIQKTTGPETGRFCWEQRFVRPEQSIWRPFLFHPNPGSR